MAAHEQMNQGYYGHPYGAPPPPRTNGCLRLAIFGCGGTLLIVLAVFIIIAIAGVRWSTRGAGFDAKATTNERVASERVGGFNDDDKRLYHHGVAHVVNTHGSIGRFTIGQVIDQERARELQRAGLAEHAVDAQDAGPAPYVVLQQWSYSCGGNGAHGARVMLKNHNPRDLPKAWAYYDASIGHDRTKCIQFEAYANEAALRIGTGHHAGPRYTDADMRTEWLNEYMYQLNVNNGYEAWIYGIKRYPNGAIDIDKHVVNPGT